MNRWRIATSWVLLASVPILLRRSTSPQLLQDTDTKVLLEAIADRRDPLSWFTGDWPLANHFYRPVSTLFFEFDHSVYGRQAWGYGLTNALIAVSCVLLLYWFVRELTDSPFVSAASATLFAWWHVDLASSVATAVGWLWIPVFLGGMFLHRYRFWNYLPAILVVSVLALEIEGTVSLYNRIVAWLPGRTASVMACFALIAMASYARYERLTAERDPLPDPGPTDPPATRSTSASRSKRTVAWPWAVLSTLALWLALASYEQAVMLPAVLLAVALTLRFQRYRVRFGWQAVFWLSLAGYLALRYHLVPSDVSGYQRQQYRTSMEGPLLALTAYILPVLGGLPGAWAVLSLGPSMLLTAQPWALLIQVFEQATTFYQARRRWVLALAGWGMSILAFLPMAWMKPFDHYHYWPMAMRSILVVALSLVLKDLLAIAWSRPILQAPGRLSPAPGSLPHR